MIKKETVEVVRQFIKFGLVGGINTILNLVIYWVCIRIGIHYLVANTIGFLITVALSYVLNNIFTFRKDRQKIDWSLKILFKVYTSYFLTGMVINSMLLWFWNDYVGINKSLAPILNLMATVPLNFVLNKVWAYKKKIPKE